jgi:prepilin signal peptidase PulO-like enzyme (type II secretory pathway)
MISGLASSPIAISRRSVLFVLALMLTAIASHLLFASLQTWPQALVLAALMSWLAVIDAERAILPNALTYTLIVTGLLEAMWFAPQHLTDRAIASLAAFSAFAALGWAYRARRKQVGLGIGDAKLLAGVGAWLGLAALPIVILVASCGALVWSAPAIVRHKQAATIRVRFGPFLSLGAWVGWLMLHAN